MASTVNCFSQCCFNPRARVRRDDTEAHMAVGRERFNPRARVRRDGIQPISLMQQLPTTALREPPAFPGAAGGPSFAARQERNDKSDC